MAGGDVEIRLQVEAKVAQRMPPDGDDRLVEPLVCASPRAAHDAQLDHHGRVSVGGGVPPWRGATTCVPTRYAHQMAPANKTTRRTSAISDPRIRRLTALSSRAGGGTRKASTGSSRVGRRTEGVSSGM